MKGKQFWITETILVFFSFILFFASLSAYYNCDGQVSTEKRDNVFSLLNPINLVSNKSVLEDSKGNLYIGNLSGDGMAVQKYNKDGRYLCSYLIDEKYRRYEVDAQDRLLICDGVQKYCYVQDQLTNITELTRKEQVDSQTKEQQTEGTIVFWTVRLKNGTSIHLEKILSWRMDYSNLLVLCIGLILLFVAISGEIKRTTENIGVDAANRRDWEQFVTKEGGIVERNMAWSEKNTDLLLKRMHQEIHCHQSVDEVREQLKVNVKPEHSRWQLGVDTNYPFYGTVNQQDFSIVLNTDNRNSFFPVIKGRIEPEENGEGSRIPVVMKTTKIVQCITAFWILLNGIILGAGLFQLICGSDSSNCLSLIGASLTALIFEELVSRLGFYREGRQAINKLRQLLE